MARLYPHMNRLELTALCAQLFYNFITLPTTIIQQSVGLLLKNEVMITAENTIKKRRLLIRLTINTAELDICLLPKNHSTLRFQLG